MGELFMLKNLVPDPRCVTRREIWAPTSGSTVKKLESGLYQYKGPSGSIFTIMVWGSNNPSSVAVGDVVFAKFSPGDTIKDVESSSSVLSGDGWIAAKRNQTTNVTLRFNPDTAVTLERCAHYTPETWEKVREMYENGSLELPYFDYKTMPREAGGGGIRPSPLAARAVRRYQWGLAA